MKQLLKNITIVLLSLFVVACTYEPETYVLSNPVAPELKGHATILVTNSTMGEDVVFAWKAARTPQKSDISYAIYGKYTEKGVLTNFGTTKDLFIKLSKKDFNQKIISAGFPETSKDEMIFIVKAYFNDTELVSQEIKVTIVSQGELIVPSAQLTLDELVLTSKNWDKEVLISWEAAKLENEAEINYKLYGTYNLTNPTIINEENGAFLLKETAENQVTFTQEEINDLLTAANIPATTASEIKLYVVAFSNEYPDGIISTPTPLNVTTYVANYPEIFYIPNTNQSWDLTKAPTLKMSANKGVYEGFVDLSNSGNVKIKFSPSKTSGEEFGGNVTTEGDKTKIISGTIGNVAEIEIPGGIYVVTLNYKMQTIKMVKVESLGLIGDATPNNWNGQTNLTYNAESNSWEGKVNFKAGNYKFRLNDDWDWAIGGNGIFGGSEPNYEFTKDPGEYKVILKTGVYPYQVSFISTNYPEKLYLPGAHQGWKPETAQFLANNGEGIYEGFIDLTDDKNPNCEFKFAPKPAWEDDFSGKITIEDPIKNQGTIEGNDNIKVPNGYYKIEVDLPNQKFTLTKITSIAFIGSFNGWKDDDPFTFDKENNVWVKENFTITTSTQFKVRLNKGWDLNFGGIAASEPHIASTGTFEVIQGGKNLSPKTDGTYKFTLDIKTTPYKLTME